MVGAEFLLSLALILNTQDCDWLRFEPRITNRLPTVITNPITAGINLR